MIGSDEIADCISTKTDRDEMVGGLIEILNAASGGPCGWVKVSEVKQLLSALTDVWNQTLQDSIGRAGKAMS